MNGNDEVAPNIEANVDIYTGLTHSNHGEDTLAQTP